MGRWWRRRPPGDPATVENAEVRSEVRVQVRQSCAEGRMLDGVDERLIGRAARLHYRDREPMRIVVLDGEGRFLIAGGEEPFDPSDDQM